MKTDDESTRYVKMLVEYVMGGDNSPTGSGFYGCESRFCSWVRTVIRPFFYESIMRAHCLVLEDFVQLCIMRLLKHVKRRPAWLFEPDANHKRLAGCLQRIARNRAADYARKRRPVWVSIDSSASDDEPEDCAIPEFPSDQDLRPDVQFDFYADAERQRSILIRFRSERLRNQPVFSRTFGAMLFGAGEYVSQYQDVGISRYWMAYQCLIQEDVHTPEPVRETLQRWFPEENYSNISARVTRLRSMFRTFIKENPDLPDTFVRTIE